MYKRCVATVIILYKVFENRKHTTNQKARRSFFCVVGLPVCLRIAVPFANGIVMHTMAYGGPPVYES